MPCTLNFNMNIWKKTLIFIITYFWIIIKKLNNSVKNRFCLIILVFYNFTFQKYNTKIQFLLEVIFEFIDWSIFSTVNCILRHKNEGCIIFMFVYTIYGKKKILWSLGCIRILSRISYTTTLITFQLSDVIIHEL